MNDSFKLMHLHIIMSNLKSCIPYKCKFYTVLQLLAFLCQNKTFSSFKANFIVRWDCSTAGRNEQTCFPRFHNRLCHLYLPEGKSYGLHFVFMTNEHLICHRWSIPRVPGLFLLLSVCEQCCQTWHCYNEGLLLSDFDLFLTSRLVRLVCTYTVSSINSKRNPF